MMTDEWVAGTGSAVRRSTPTAGSIRRSRTDADRAALLEGLLDGTIDCIATDHAPHTSVDKDCEFDQAAPGISGLETAFGLLMRLVDAGQIDLPTLIRLLTIEPAQVFGLEGRHAAGRRARPTWSSSTLAPSGPSMSRKFHSKGRNSPLHGERFRGLIRTTMVGGEVVHEVPQ